MRIHKNITVIGQVQGVYFRVSTMNQAVNLKVAGYVCNKKDGSVFIEAEGSENSVTEFIEWCKSGPSNAVVDDVKVVDAPMSNYHDFHIHYGS